MTPSGLIEHLRILFAFEEMSEEEKAGIDPEALKNSVRCVRHVLVTFTHVWNEIGLGSDSVRN